MVNTKKSFIELGGEKYEVSIKNGKRMIGKKTIDEFIDDMIKIGRWDIIFQAAAVGREVIKKAMKNN